MKIVQYARFRSCAARFGQIAFLSVKVVKIVTLAVNSLQKEKTVRFSWKLYKTLVFRSCAVSNSLQNEVLPKSYFLRVKLLKHVRLVSNSLQNGKTVRFSWKLYKTLFSGHAQHVLAKSHFWASNGSQNRHTGLKFSSKRENSALFMKIVQNALFRSCAARFGQIVFLRVKVVKIVTLAWNSLQKGKTVRFSWKLYKTLVSGHAQHVLAKSHFWASKFSKSSHWPEILSKKGKQCAFHENCTKRSFQVMRSTFWPNRIFERQSCQNRHTGLKFSPKRENSALFMKIVQNALFRSCAARFGQIAFLSVKVVKIVTLAWNSLQKGKTVRFSWKLYKTLVSGHAQHVLAKSHFSASQLSKSSRWPQILSKKEKQCDFHEKYKTLFSAYAQHVLAKSHFWASKSSKRLSPKRENSALLIVQNARFRSCAARFGQIAFLSVKVVQIVILASNSLKTGKECAFHENCTKCLFQVLRSTFWPNRILERQSCQNRHTGLNSLQKGKTVRFSWKLYKTLVSGHAQHVLAKSHFWASKLWKSSHWP